MVSALTQWLNSAGFQPYDMKSVFDDIRSLDETKEVELRKLFCEYLSRALFPLCFGGNAFATHFVMWLISRNNSQDADKWGYLIDRAREITRRRTGYYERPAQLLLENKTPDDG